jgi:hypothetical protein
MHGIDTAIERNTAFFSESELLEMRENDVEITDEQWQEFWRIIEQREIDTIRARVESSKMNAEMEDYNRRYPLQRDSDGHYRVMCDWDGRVYKEYEGWK